MKVVKNIFYADFHLSHSFLSSLAVSLLSPWGSALLLLHIFGQQFYPVFGWSVKWHCCLVLSALAANMTNWGQTKISRKIPGPYLCVPLAGLVLCVVALKSPVNHFFEDSLSFWIKCDKISFAYKFWADMTPVGLCLCEGFSGKVYVRELSDLISWESNLSINKLDFKRAKAEEHVNLHMPRPS